MKEDSFQCDPDFPIYESMFRPEQPEPPTRLPLKTLLRQAPLTEREIEGHGYSRIELRQAVQDGDIERWDFLMKKPLYYRSGKIDEPSEAEIRVLEMLDRAVKPPVNTFDDVVYEAMTKAPTHVAGFSFVKDFINANPVRMYRTMHHLLESGRLDEWLTRGEKSALEEAKIFPISEEDVDFLGAKRLVRFDVLSKMGDGYWYSYCSGLTKLLGDNGMKALQAAAEGDKTKIGNARPKLRGAGLLNSEGDISPFGRECLNYLNSCPFNPDAMKNYPQTLKTIYRNWKDVALQSGDPGALTNAVRVLSKLENATEKHRNKELTRIKRAEESEKEKLDIRLSKTEEALFDRLRVVRLHGTKHDKQLHEGIPMLANMGAIKVEDVPLTLSNYYISIVDMGMANEEHLSVSGMNSNQKAACRYAKKRISNVLKGDVEFWMARRSMDYGDFYDVARVLAGSRMINYDVPNIWETLKVTRLDDINEEKMSKNFLLESKAFAANEAANAEYASNIRFVSKEKDDLTVMAEKFLEKDFKKEYRTVKKLLKPTSR
ncbi:MAG: hypothetical protein V1887_01300 [Candidatus Aenigmatarchaeota archaeon]